MKLTRNQFKQVKAALDDAFSTRDGLERLARLVWNSSLDQLAFGENVGAVIVKMIGLAEEGDKLDDLIQGALELRPSNDLLHSLQEGLQPIIAAPGVDYYTVRFLQKGWAIVNRHVLRDALWRLNGEPPRRLNEDPPQSRILIVDGQRYSGKTYSVQLIAYLKERLANFKMARVDLEHLVKAAKDGRISPVAVGESMSSQWGLKGMPKQQKEPDARWVLRFCDWLTGELENATTMHWVVFDHFDKVLLKPGAHDLIKQLASRVYVNITKLRLVLLSYQTLDDLQTVVPGNIEHEVIPAINADDLMQFLIDEYEDRKQQRNINYSSDDIATSVAQILRQVDPIDQRRLESLRKAVAVEVNRLWG